MKNQNARKIGIVPPVMAGVGSPLKPFSGPPISRQKNLLERWRRLATGLRGAHLFRVTVAVGGKVFWAVECTLSGARVCRRFASELHARAWLSMAAPSGAVLSPVERQEIDRLRNTSYPA